MAPILHFIEGGDSHRCALIDNALVTLTVNNGWEGIIIYGYIRDTAIITKLPIGIRTLNTHPTKP
jgi:regulator of ribonuclease activity A